MPISPHVRFVSCSRVCTVLLRFVISTCRSPIARSGVSVCERRGLSVWCAFVCCCFVCGFVLLLLDRGVFRVRYVVRFARVSCLSEVD